MIRGIFSVGRAMVLFGLGLFLGTVFPFTLFQILISAALIFLGFWLVRDCGR